MIHVLICHNSYPAPPDDDGRLGSFDSRIAKAVEHLYPMGDGSWIKYASNGYIVKKETELVVYYCLIIRDRSLLGWQENKVDWLAGELIYNTPSEEVRIFEIDTNYLDIKTKGGIVEA